MLFFVGSLEMCMPSPPVCAWTKDMTDAEVQVEAVTPAGYDKEVGQDGV